MMPDGISWRDSVALRMTCYFRMLTHKANLEELMNRDFSIEEYSCWSSKLRKKNNSNRQNIDTLDFSKQTAVD